MIRTGTGASAAFLACFLGLAPAMALDASLQPDGPGSFSLSANGLSVGVDVQPAAENTFRAEVRVTEGGRVVAATTLDELYSAFSLPGVRFVEMDASNDRPEVQMTVWTGGAHCCNEVSVFSKDEDSWKKINFGSFDSRSDVGAFIDADFDGVHEIITYDDRFLYEFASYAGSWAPMRIFGVRDGQARDVTREPQFADVVRRSLDRMGELPDAREPRNSWLATYAATLVLLGEDDPLDFAVGSHDPSVEWGMVRCTVAEVDYQCPEGKETVLDFEAALTDFLTRTGYLE